ncbi:MAG: carbohydrate ABC transporter permease [Oscillospiraceae bacterium]|jgi:multiple sugar transport system permease protein|nr:carbohydrate ABC transporter permease [Oscillospiraceae bacterium]
MNSISKSVPAFAVSTQSRKRFAQGKGCMIRGVIRWTILLSAVVYTLFPFYWMATSALKSKEEVFQFPPVLLPSVCHWNVFPETIQAAPFLHYVFNSTFTAVCIVLIQIINSAMFAYVLTQFHFRGKTLLFAVIMATYMLPDAATYVPSYIIIAHMGLLNTYRGLIISNSVSVFSIFLVRQAFLQVHRSTIESAKMDGASHWRILWNIMVPLCKPTFITLGLIAFVTSYNNYMWPSLIAKDPNLYLVTTGLRQFFIEDGAYGIKWPQVMAASTITVLPLVLLYLFAQKYLIQGISESGVKE